MDTPRNVVFLAFEGVEPLDLFGPWSVFSAAARVLDPTPFELHIAAEELAPFTTWHGPRVEPTTSFGNAPKADVLVVPGGRGTRAQLLDDHTREWVRSAAADAELVLSVCTGALLLADAGLLEGLVATTHHQALDLLERVSPKTDVRRDVSWVDNGRIITSAGIASGIDAALLAVGRVLGEEARERTERHVEIPRGKTPGIRV